MTKPLFASPDPQGVARCKELLVRDFPGGRALAAAWDEQPWRLLFTSEYTPNDPLSATMLQAYPPINVPLITVCDHVRAQVRLVPALVAEMLDFTEHGLFDLTIYLESDHEWPHHPTREELITELCTTLGGNDAETRLSHDPRFVPALTELLDLLGLAAFDVIDEYLPARLPVADDFVTAQLFRAFGDAIACGLTELVAAYRAAHT